MIEPSPILLFTYKRLKPLQKTIEALQKNELAINSDLYIFSDGPKTDKDEKQIKTIRNYLSTVNGFQNVYISASPTNKGLANSIISGVSSVLKSAESVIVLEDDLLTTPNYLVYMNKALANYKNNTKVFSISGYAFDLRNGDKNPNSTYFLNRGWSWGWATWRNRWDKVDWAVRTYPEFVNDKKQRKAFSKGGSDLNAMLDKQMTGKLDSWAIRWFYHQFIVGGLTLYPLGSKIYNDGFDEFATHTNGSEKRYIPFLDTVHSTEFDFPDEIKINIKYQKRFQNKLGIFARIRSKIETLLLKNRLW